MSLASLIHKRLVDLLDEKRVVVWYDGENAFGDLAQSFKAPSCAVISTVASRLRARREADEVLSRLDDSEFPAEQRNANLLIYAPWPRAKTDSERRADPFESFALIGAAFGDKPAEQFQSLARQAMPQRITEIDRLFREGKPNLELIEGLSEAVKFPLVEQAVGTDSAVEVAALLLCRDGATTKLKEVPGAEKELLRLLQSNFGFGPPTGVSSVDAILGHFGRYALFSEFALDLPAGMPEELTTVPHAGEEHRDRVFALCDRMRGTDDTRENYIALAQRVEQDLRLAEVSRHQGEFGNHDTFPFEERFHLARLAGLARSEKLAEAKRLIEERRRSVWHHVADRAVLWKVAERCVDLLSAISPWMARIPRAEDSVRAWVSAYTAAEGMWQVDRCQRLMEQSAAECAEDKEVEELVGLCRQNYFQFVEFAQSRFLKAVERDGWPPEDVLRQTQVFDRYIGSALDERRRVAFFLVDAMRYEMGRDAARAIESLGAVKVAPAASVLPTTTLFGMAALMPGADSSFTLVEDGDDLTPSIAGHLLRGSSERMNLLKERYGDRFQELRFDQLLSISQKKLQTTVGKADLVVIRTPDIDSLGEGQSSYRARKLMTDIIGELRTATDRLIACGIETVVFAADHGHFLLPDVAAGDVLQLPPGDWKKAKRRSLLGSSLGTAPGVAVFPATKMGIVGPVPELAVATGFRVFSAGASYFHEGVSLQECIIPVVVLEAGGRPTAQGGGEEIAIRYRNDYFSSRVIGIKVWFNALLRESIAVRLEAFDGPGAKAKVVGESADCDARDPATGLVTLEKGKETQVPIRIRDDFAGASVEIRACDPSTGAVLHKLSLRNSLLD